MRPEKNPVGIKIAALVIFILAGGALFAQGSEGLSFDLGRYFISITPKILPEGVQTDVAFGIYYTKAMKLAGELRLRQIKEAGNDTVWGIKDSLMTRERQVYEGFFLPVNYYFLKKDNFTIKAGAGLYYEYQKLNENGFFNDKNLFEPPGEDRYSSYTNYYSGHSVGPLLDAGFNFKYAIFKSSLSFGMAPVFYLNRNQTWKLLPYMNPNPSYSAASKSMCGPYYYLSLDLAFDLKYLSVLFTLLHEYSGLKYTAAGFNDTTGEWADVSEKIKYKKLAFEISVLANLGKSGIMPQLGYGRTIDAVSGGDNYFIIGAKKQWF